MRKQLTTIAMALLMAVGAQAQRVTDQLDRGLVAVKTTSGVYLSWRINASEYYDVKYNIYRDGTKLNAEPLEVSNYTDSGGTTSSKYTVKAVVLTPSADGGSSSWIEQEASKEVTALSNNYKSVNINHPSSLKATYIPNDACCADVDGDGEVEILLKLDNQEESQAYYQKEGYYNGTFSEYTLLECMKLDGTVLWWVNCGPNMGDFQNNEQNIVGYDWDMDGKAEVVMRLEEGSEVHMADGTSYIIGADGKNGSSWTNYRGYKGANYSAATATLAYNIASGATATSNASWCVPTISNGKLTVKVEANTDTSNGRSAVITVKEGTKTRTFGYSQTRSGLNSVEWFTHYGNEFLFYCEGATGKPYQCIDFPLKRLESGETDLNAAWGDGYGHRSSKYFFGAPYLDGKHPSIFLGRGIYTRHKFVALDVNPANHELTTRWSWTNNKAGSPWYAQGYHNYSIADVDWDGRDEIIWGSMVIDDNGKGLSTTGLGHGDAHHVGDLNPYVHGQEGFFCNEDQPANNYRDLTTSKIYYRMTDTNDAGRALAGNFYNTLPGAIGYGAHDTPISTVTNNHASVNTNGLGMNFRIYWDGDLQEECFDNIVVSKPGVGTLATFSGSASNNGTKATPCYQGDIFGDWREEVIVRNSSNPKELRIYTTTTPTQNRNYSLWYDHQYRNAMVWQPCGYNQPPHASYFLGELEGITIAPPPLTTRGREEVSGSIGTSLNGKHAMLDATADVTVAVADGASPAIFTDNAPSWVQGSAPSECTTKETAITYTYYTHTLTGGAFKGNMRLVKQGDGTLVLPKVTETYTGNTDVWAGKLSFDGTMQNSQVWLNRFAELNSDGGVFNGGIKADYASVIRPGGEKKVGTITTSNLQLGFGARVVFDADGTNVDMIKATAMTIEKKTWENGPEYSAPVFEFTSAPAAGTYTLAEVGTLTGNISDITVEGLTGKKYTLAYADGKLTIDILDGRSAEDNVTWTGANGSSWDLLNTENFSSSDKKFVSGDAVIFDDNALTTNVVLNETVSPSSVVFKNNTKTYTLSGTGSIDGDIPLTLAGTGTVNINNINKYSGGTFINGGILVPASLANNDGSEYGALGGVDNSITIANGGTLKVNGNVTASHAIVLGQDGGSINAASTLILNGGIKKVSGSTNRDLYKTGNGTLQLNCTADYDKMYINAGTVYDFQDAHFSGKTIVLNGTKVTLKANNSIYGEATDNVTINVPAGKSGIWYPDGRCNYTGKLTGAGTIDIYATWVRCFFKGDWSAFTGTINAKRGSKNVYEPVFDFSNTYGMPNATLNVDAAFIESAPFYTNGKSFSIGALTGTGYISSGGNVGNGANTLTIGTANKDFTFSGTINGSNVVKAGTGVWTIATEKILANAKSLKVTGGAVKLTKAAATTSMTSSTITYVQGEGELRGQGYVYGVNLLSGGTLRAGLYAENNQTSNVGVLTIAKNLSAEAGSHIYVNKTKADSLTVNTVTLASTPAWAYLNVLGNATLNGTIHVTYKSSWTPAEGDYVRVLNCGGTLSGEPSFELQALPAGLGWDTSDFLATGKIRVVYGTGIYNVSADIEQAASIYTAGGYKVATITTTAQNLVRDMKAIGLSAGLYIVRMATGSKKVMIK